MITWEYHKQFHVSQLMNVEEMDTFLESYNFPRINQEEMENMNKPITTQK